jgi:hypothetical protein
MTRHLLAAICLLAALLLCVPAADAAKRRVPRGFFGAVFDGPVRDVGGPLVTQEFGRMASSGVESVRTNFVWAQAESTPGVTDFARTDLVVREAAAHGVALLPVVTGAPRWARRFPRRTGSPPRRAADYTAYLEKLVGRYGPQGSFWTENPEVPKRPIREWQIWNEPNLPYQWHHRQGRENFRRVVAPAYGALLRASRRTIKRADRRAKVVLAALTNDSWNALSDLFARGRIRRQFDAAGMNAYSKKAGDFLLIADAVRDVLQRNGHARTPLFITEFAAPAAKGRIPVQDYQRRFITTDRGMAALVRSAYRAFATRGRRRLGIKRAYWYTWASSYRRGGDLGFFEFAGLRRFSTGGGSDRQALRAYRASARLFEGCKKTTTGTCR